MTGSPSRYSHVLPLLGAPALLLLTAAALFWPQAPDSRGDGSLLVLLPEPDPYRTEVLADLADHLGACGRLDLHLEVVTDRDAFDARLSGAQVVLCPDGVALPLPAAAWQPLAAGRRRLPWNLRPTSVLVTRRAAAAGVEPWLDTPARTVFGDSLSLVCLAPLCEDGNGIALPAGVSWGPDPYDHRGVLAATRHGAFDHAVVRQWDAAFCLTSGRLDPALWEVRPLSVPLPDVVVLASRRLPRAVRLDLQEALTVLGRRDGGDHAGEPRPDLQLGVLGLEGFNLLLGPDFDRLRHRFGPCWPRRDD